MSDEVDPSKELRAFPIYEVGTRVTQLMGCDRELLLFTAGMCGIIWFTNPHVTFVFVALAIFFVALKILRMAGKADAKLRDVVIRHYHYQSKYCARSTPFNPSRRKYG